MIGRRRSWLVVLQHPPAGPLQILELPGVQRPQEGEQTGKAECQRARDKPRQGRHQNFTFRDLSRSALPVTASDDADMAIAAKSGVT